MQKISAMMASFAPPEESKTKRKKRGTKKTKSNKPKKKQNDTGSYTGDQWQYWSEKSNQERKEWHSSGNGENQTRVSTDD